MASPPAAGSTAIPPAGIAVPGVETRNASAPGAGNPLTATAAAGNGVPSQATTHATEEPDLGIIVKSLGDALSLVPPSLGPDPGFRPAAPGLGAATSGEALYFLRAATTPAPPSLDKSQSGMGDRSPSLEPLDPTLAPDFSPGARPFDAASIKRDFPILGTTVHGKPLVWLDSAATTQKPQAVIDRLASFYEHENSNVHRGAHALAARATDAYEGAREKVRRFIGASDPGEIIFTRGTTEAINLVAQAWGGRFVGEGDEIVITWLEHHANIVPWQQLCAAKGARLRVAPVDDGGRVIMAEYERLIGPRTRLVAFSQVSNALGTVLPVQEMVEIAHRRGACVLVDGAQAVSHMRVDVQALDADFYFFSGHKLFGPTGIGVLYGKSEVLKETPPWQGGGNMIGDVTFERTLYREPPVRFEAGTPNIADAAGLGAAIDYLDRIGMENIQHYEQELLAYGTQGLLKVPGLNLLGTAPEKAGVMSFVLDGQRTEDVGKALDREGIAVRAGHHCAQPIHRRFGLQGSVRASLAFYNTVEDLDALCRALHRLQVWR
jgi:cysteine desulfurase / selenocysteine lyase